MPAACVAGPCQAAARLELVHALTGTKPLCVLRTTGDRRVGEAVVLTGSRVEGWVSTVHGVVHTTGVVAAIHTVAAHAVAWSWSRSHAEDWLTVVGEARRWRGFLRGHLSTGGAAAAVILLNSLSDATTVGRVTNAWNNWTHDLDQHALGLWVGVVQSSLNDIVGKTIVHHLLQLVGVGQLHDQCATSLLTRGANALLNDVGAELLTRQWGDVSKERLAEWLTKLGLANIHDVLNHVVAERILDQRVTMFRNGANNLCSLSAGGVVDTALKNTASVTMSTNNDNMGTDSIDNELNVVVLEVVETLLNDMVAVQVLNQADNIAVESSDNHLNLNRTGDEFDHLLEGTSAVLVESDLDHLRRGALDKRSALLIIGVLKELLAEVVAKWI